MDRDCSTCIHHTEKGCRKWDCEYEKRMSVEEAIMQLDWRKDFATPSQITALDMAIRSLRAWEKVKKEIEEHSHYIQYDKYGIEKGMSLTGIMEVIDKALGEVGESK